MIRNHLPAILLQAVIGLGFPLASASAQAIHVTDAPAIPEEQSLRPLAQLPVPLLSDAPVGDVTLLPGLFLERQNLGKAYLLRLKTDGLLQNYYLEAGVRIDTPYDQMYQGWESPSCQLRGHFVGHWLSAVAHLSAINHDPVLEERASEVVKGLAECQQLNGGEWVGSIPEKYFTILADGKRWIWSPQYTLHKTMMGLFDAYSYLHDTQALAVDGHSADWFLTWTGNLLKEGRGDAIYGGECAGMLELWANLYGATHDPKYLTLASRYSMPDMFRQLLAGEDPLSNQHANASIPWIQGAARLYEVTGDARYRQIVENFWKVAVEKRGMFATTGNNAGEYWIPPGEFGRFLGNRTQEHCTVYNMIRVAEYLFRWTGDARYADYIERALYNGILAQQNPSTGMVCYFLPLQPGAKKVWGSETHDFWCCDGTMVQAQAMYEDLIYYRAADGVTVSQFIPSKASFGDAGKRIQISQTVDLSAATANFSAPGDETQVFVNLDVTSDDAAPWTLRIRQPFWARGAGVVTVDGKQVAASVDDKGFLEIRREWKSAHLRIAFVKALTREPLPGDSRRFALLDGPVVLAALSDSEPVLRSGEPITPQYEHQYNSREWQSGHFLARTEQGSVALVPLFEVADQAYTVYLSSEK